MIQNENQTKRKKSISIYFHWIQRKIVIEIRKKENIYNLNKAMIWSSFNDTFLLYRYLLHRSLWISKRILMDAFFVHHLISQTGCCVSLLSSSSICRRVLFVTFVIFFHLSPLWFKMLRVCTSARAPLILNCAIRLKDYSTQDYSHSKKESSLAQKKKLFEVIVEQSGEEKKIHDKKIECVNLNLSIDSFPNG